MHAFSMTAAAVARRRLSIELGQAAGAAKQALERGCWVAASDACLKGGQGAGAFALFAPSGDLVLERSFKLCDAVCSNSTDAEAACAMAALEAMGDLGVRAAALFCDCKGAIDRLEAMPKGALDCSFHWMPREGLGPANDAARSALGLRPEKSSARSWEQWPVMAKVAGKAPRMG